MCRHRRWAFHGAGRGGAAPLCRHRVVWASNVRLPFGLLEHRPLLGPRALRHQLSGGARRCVGLGGRAIACSRLWAAARLQCLRDGPSSLLGQLVRVGSSAKACQVLQGIVVLSAAGGLRRAAPRRRRVPRHAHLQASLRAPASGPRWSSSRGALSAGAASARKPLQLRGFEPAAQFAHVCHSMVWLRAPACAFSPLALDFVAMSGRRPAGLLAPRHCAALGSAPLVGWALEGGGYKGAQGVLWHVGGACARCPRLSPPPTTRPGACTLACLLAEVELPPSWGAIASAFGGWASHVSPGSRTLVPSLLALSPFARLWSLPGLALPHTCHVLEWCGLSPCQGSWEGGAGAPGFAPLPLPPGSFPPAPLGASRCLCPEGSGLCHRCPSSLIRRPTCQPTTPPPLRRRPIFQHPSSSQPSALAATSLASHPTP